MREVDKHRGAAALRFADFEFTPATLELRRNGEPVRLPHQPAQLLAALLREPGRLVTREELQREIWPDRVVDFDANLNFTIRQVRTALGEKAGAPTLIETLPRQGYRFIGEVERAASMRADRPDRRAWLAAVGLVAVVALTALWIEWSGTDPAGVSPEGPEIRSLAVLPFENLGSSPAEQPFVDGLTADLINELANLSPESLRVIAHGSVRDLGPETVDTEMIGVRLGVDYVVRGDARREGERRRIHARLERVADGASIWAARFDRDPGEDLLVQADIARAVAGELAVELGPRSGSARLAELPPDVRERVAMARWWLGAGREFDPRAAMNELAPVRDAYPDNALAWALTSQAAINLGDRRGAEEAARRAVALDPDLAAGHYWLGQVLRLTLRAQEALAAYERAVALEPGNAVYRQLLGHQMANLLRFDEAIQQLELAAAMDPLSTSIDADFGYVHLAAGDAEGAERLCTRSLEMNPANTWARTCLLWAHYVRAEHAAAVEQALEIQRAAGASADDLARVSDVDPRSGVRAFFEWNLDRLQSQKAAGEEVLTIRLARAHAALGDADATLAALGEVVATRSFGAAEMAREVWFRFLHDNRDYRRLLRQAGLPLPGGDLVSVSQGP